ncbi:MAG: DUF6798 domain-containing protein [Bacteroidota bacterium]
MPSSTSRRSDAPTALLAGALIAVLHPLRFGYQYGTGDHDDLLPPIFARLDPGLFALDAYVQGQLDGVTVRTAFRTVVRSLASVMPMPTAVGCLHLVASVGVGAGVYTLARALRGGRTASVLAAVLACVVVPTATIGGNAVLYSLLTPEGMAWAFAIPAMAFFVRDKRLLAGAFLGIAAWFHLLAAGLVGLGLVLAAVLEARYEGEGWKSIGGFAGLAAFVAAPIAAPALLRQAAEAGAQLPDGLDPFTLYAILRFPHHYLPSGTGLSTWVLFLVAAGSGIAGYRVAHTSSRPPDTRFPVRFAFVSLGLILLAMVGVLAADSLFLARVQTLKLTVVLNVLACIGIAIGAISRVPSSMRQRTDQWLRRKPRRLLAAALVLVLLGVPSRGSPDADRAAAVAQWAFMNTPRDAVFAVPPSLSGFRVPSQRSAVVTWKSVPFRTDLAADWWTRLTTVAPLATPPATGRGLVEALDAAYASQPDSARQAFADLYGADYAVVPAETETELPVEFESGPWRVLRLR